MFVGTRLAMNVSTSGSLMTLSAYAHVIDELGGQTINAEEQIALARNDVVPLGYPGASLGPSAAA